MSKTSTRKTVTKRKSPRRAKPAYRLPKGKVLVMRTSGKNGEAYGGFVWPKSGVVKCPDWKKVAECGNGLHGLLWGAGEASHLSDDADARWYALEVGAKSLVDLEGKVKFPTCKIVICGDRRDVTDLIQKHAPAGNVCNGGTATAGDRGTATAGNYGTATAGDRGTATAGNYGTATAGNYGTATAGDRGTATAGYGGTISIAYYEPDGTYRRAIAEIGPKGLSPNTKYRVTDCKLVQATD